MVSDTTKPGSQTELIRAALDGDDEAARAVLAPESQRKLVAMLMQRGATASEADEIAGDIWSEALQEWKGKRPLLERFDGEGDIVAFLGRCALNRLIDRKRRARFRGDLPESAASRSKSGDAGGDGFDLLEGETGEFGEVDDALVDLLRDALLKAMSKAPPQALLMVKLAMLHGIQQKTLAEMWGWSRSKVCRAMNAAMEQLRDDALAHIAEVDPWLEVGWGDLVQLCAQSSGFLR